MTGCLFTGFGFWDIGTWLLFFVVAGVVVSWIRSQGRQDYKKGTDQDQIYFSGNELPENPTEITVPASSSYWGYRKALRPYYDRLIAFHSGYTVAYVGWFVVTTAILLVLIFVQEGRL
ncbi:MAG: hydrogenase [Dethiosulfovibrio peptidovorans]|nr:MAG: hydrogenase [Dethiosulfovibrio peptidovorans]